MTVCLAFQIEVIRAINQLLKFFFSLLQQSALLSGLVDNCRRFLPDWPDKKSQKVTSCV